MKKIIKLLLIIFLVSINITILKADCESDKEAIKELNIDKENYMMNDKYLIGFQINSFNDLDIYAVVDGEINAEPTTVEMKKGYME